MELCLKSEIFQITTESLKKLHQTKISTFTLMKIDYSSNISE